MISSPPEISSKSNPPTIPVINHEASSENSIGAPSVIFIKDVKSFMEDGGKDTNQVLSQFAMTLQKYSIMIQNLKNRVSNYEEQIPEMESSLEIVKLAKVNKSEGRKMDVFVNLTDDVSVKGIVPATDKVLLWLGANVLAEYSLDEAETFLNKSISDLKNAAEVCSNDIEFLQKQITVIEVNTSRVYNYGVCKRKENQQPK
ncbi:hypothetical protein ACOME3_003947 [Neoechinorhynchus agilis]